LIMSIFELMLGPFSGSVEETYEDMSRNGVVRRLWDMDYTLWKPVPAEISNRLGWLAVTGEMRRQLADLAAFSGEVRAAGYMHALLLGMGGSSLGAEVIRKTYGVKDGFLDLRVLDSTDPAAITGHAERIDPSRTLFIVPTKSGSTVETLSFFKFFYTRLADELGRDKAGAHFVAITDPGTSLVELAEKFGFRKIFSGEPAIGGRYSVLSPFGLVPAAVTGADIPALLDRADGMAALCRIQPGDGNDNPGLRLGAAMGALARMGRDKLTFVISDRIASFGDWVEQLIAESSGKEGKGILPVIGETLGDPSAYTGDRVFVFISLGKDAAHETAAVGLRNAGHPVIRIALDDPYDLGAQFFLWEFAVAVACHVLGINPFDQPDVESAKVLSRKAMEEHSRKGGMSEPDPFLCEDRVCVYGADKAGSIREVLRDFLGQMCPGSYVSLQAYLKPDNRIERELDALRIRIRDRYRTATTIGFGPRFLHSTGQLHKGDAGRGFFIQITCDDRITLSIPDEAGSPASSATFGILKAAQAKGDYQALSDRGRHIIRFHIQDPDIPAALSRIAQAIS
jgi:glucose-6-phosphate isomerase/transaldolase/glucose-6-phosphate isomerase